MSSEPSFAARATQGNTAPEEARAADSKNSLRAWLYLLKCAKRLEQEMSDRFRAHFGSSLSRFDVLAHLDLAGADGLSTSQLASRLLASKGNITRLLDRMEQDGLVVRKASSDDRRINKIHLSPNGRDMFRQMAPAHETWSHEVFSSLTLPEMNQLLQLLRRVRDRIENRAESGPRDV